MTDLLAKTDERIKNIVRQLQNAGYETYIVGGAVRDLLLGRPPKDYDISTAATPQEIRNVFGRRAARIIGKRFRLVHLMCDGDIIEISTFRRRPASTGAVPDKLSARGFVPDKMLFEDNDFGTSKEDAFRRDFTVNALFYDPVADKLIDYTGMGLADIQDQVVRIIGDGHERFEEDPVRLLRALKLVGQYGFRLAPETEKALRDSIQLIQLAAPSRMALELEKILISAYSSGIIRAFRQYGFLYYFLPYIDRNWEAAPIQRAMAMLECRNRRVLSGRYRGSVSVAVVAIALPLVADMHGATGEGELWQNNQDTPEIINSVIRTIFSPHNLIKRVTAASTGMLLNQPVMFNYSDKTRVKARILPHARELLYIQNELWWHRSDLIEKWENPGSCDNTSARSRRRRRRPYRSRRRKDNNTGIQAASPENTGE